MTEDEVSVNNQMEKAPVTQEISPWMKKHLENRSLPFSPQGLIELLRNGSRLTKSVVKHTGIQDVLSRIGNLGFLSKSYRSIISRAGRAEPPDIYRMLDLPWFRQGGDESPEQRQSSHLHAKEESVSPAIKKQLSESPIESLVSKKEKTTDYITRLMQPPISRNTAITIGNSIGPNPVKSSPPRIEQNPQVDYPTDQARLIKNGSVTKIVIPSKILTIKEVRQQDIPKTSGHQPPHVNFPSEDKVKSSRIASFETGSNETVRQQGDLITFDKKEQTNTSRRNTRTSLVNNNNREKRLIREPPKSLRLEKPSTAIKPISMPPALSEKKIETKGHDSIADSKRSNMKITENGGHDQARLRDENRGLTGDTEHGLAQNGIHADITVSYDTVASSKSDFMHENIEAGHGLLKKSSDRGKTRNQQDVSHIYPAPDLFIKKPLSIGRRIIQSLPLIRNIKRKDNKALKPASTINEKQGGMKDRLALKEIDLVYTNQEPNTPDIPENSINAATDAGIASKAEVVVLPQVSRSNDNTTQQDNPPSEVSQTMIKRKEASQIYPFKDLVHTRMHSTRQQIVRSLPLIRNWSKTNQPVSRANEKSIVSNGSNLTQNNLEIPQVQEITASPSVAAPSSPNFRMIAENNIIGTHDEVPQNVLQRLLDFNRTSNNREIDLTLAPANQTNTTLRGEDYQSRDQVIHLQRDQSPASSPSTVQTQTDQTQTQNTAQSTVTQNVENNTNQNSNQPDIKALAREVYPLIRRMIIIERERRPSL